MTPKVDYPMLTFEGGWGHVVAVLLEIEAKPVPPEPKTLYTIAAEALE